jgi:tricorn protease
MRLSSRLLLIGFAFAFHSSYAFSQSAYFREPGLAENVLTFVSEGDLWRVNPEGGSAVRLTTHAAREARPHISPDGRWVAFIGRYEGPAEVYVMPIEGGAPRRLTYDGVTQTRVVGWRGSDRVLFANERYAGPPIARTYSVAISGSEAPQPIPLDDVDGGCYVGNEFFFTRKARWSDNVKNYKGGLAKSIWRFDGKSEAKPLTADYAGMSMVPMCARDRIYFLTDRDGAMNVWSMNQNGSDLKQHTRHNDFDVRSASLAGTRIVYQLGADLYRLNLTTSETKKLAITLASDFDQTRTRWIRNPLNFVTDASVSPNGDRVALSLRGQLIVAPVGIGGRRVEVTRDAKARVRSAHFSSDGKTIYALTTQTGEQELASFPANGVGTSRPITTSANAIRDVVLPSPDSKRVLIVERSGRMLLVDALTQQTRAIEDFRGRFPEGFAWSPDSRWLAFGADAGNGFDQLVLYDANENTHRTLTSNRYESRWPAWSPDGNFLYFLGDRNLQTVVRSPWGQRNPMPFFDRQARVYAFALNAKARWPFQLRDELHAASAASAPTPTTPSPTPTQPPPPSEPSPNPSNAASANNTAAAATPATTARIAATSNERSATSAASATKPIVVEFEKIADRLYEVPMPAGNYSQLRTDGKRLFFLATDAAYESKTRLMSIAIDDARPNPDVFMEDVSTYQLSSDGKKLLVRRTVGGNPEFAVFDAAAKPPTTPEALAKTRVDLGGLAFEIDPRDEWRQLFDDAWRLHRDTFYDPNLHGVDWKAQRAKFAPLVERVNDRSELDDVLAQMISELRLLHSQVGGGDMRMGADNVDVAALAADVLPAKGGVKVVKHFNGDPELIDERSPLARAESRVEVGEIISEVNGRAIANAMDLARELRNRTNRQVLLTVKRDENATTTRQIIVMPIGAQRDVQLRYAAWERERTSIVERTGAARIGYVNLRAMGRDDMATFAREFYPVWQREGLIIDLRNNGGGNIDSWIVSILQRRAWAFWTNRTAREPYPNQQLAFRGHIVALIDGSTYSDGETLAEALRRLGIATLIGKRSAGAGVWLSDRNVLADNGIARAAENPYFDLQGRWFVEGAGVKPDIEVDNLPHATFNGEDAQLAAAIKFLQEKIAKEPIPKPVAPPYPAYAK